MNKLSVALVFGGRSTEHEISILSAESIINQIDRSKYQLSLIKIDLNSEWWFLGTDDLNDFSQAQKIHIEKSDDQGICKNANGASLAAIDVFFPILHGIYGEDGTIQGFFRMMDVAFVGCDVLASAACMDKDITKRLLRDANIQIAPYLMATRNHIPAYAEAKKNLGDTLFLKPANMGSSVGVYKVDNEADYLKRIEEGLSLDKKVLIEMEIKGREIECAVLGNDNPKASTPGEIVMNSDFYDFESKYVDDQASSTIIPADLKDETIASLRSMAINAYKVLECEGLARVDFFLTEEGKLMINEINTMPGFTSISMYPKMWEASGISYPELIDILIQLALERRTRQKQLKIFAKKVSSER
jgi:D-alanine-D-alanine ligase